VRSQFTVKAAELAAAITAVLPEFIVASNSYSPTVLYHLGIVALFLLLERIDDAHRLTGFMIGLVCGALALLRSEFVLTAGVIMCALWWEKRRRHLPVMLLTVVAVVAPWQVRNYLVFERPVLLSTNAGLNLYRGNNPGEIGDWNDEQRRGEACRPLVCERAR
jgi:hypothetical protein